MAGPSIAVRVIGDLSAFAKSMGDTANQGQNVAGKLHSAFSGAISGINAIGFPGLGDALDGIDKAIGQIAEHGKQIGPMLTGVGAAVTGVGVGLTALGSKDQAAQQQLQASIEATGHSYDDYADRVEAAVKHNERFGDTANQTKDALRVLTQATNDPTKALADMGVATDLAAAKHEDLNTASTQLARMLNGNAKLLKEYGINQKDAAGHAKTHDEILTELSAKLSGQASAAADTFGGKLKSLKATVEDSVASFGQKYGPAITAAGAAMTGLGTAMQLAKVAAIAFNAVMAANPVVLVALAIVGLVAGFVLLYQHVSWFHDLVQTVWHWIADHWPLLLAILLGPIGIAIDLIVKNFGFLRDTVMWVWDNVLKPIFDAIVWYWTLVANAVKWGWENVIKPVWDALSAAVSWLWNNILKPAFDSMKTEWSDIGNVFKWVWDNVLKPVFDAFANVASWLWNNVLKPAFDGMNTEWSDIGNGFKWVWDNVLKPVFDAVKRAADDVSGAIGKVVDPIKSITGGIGGVLGHIPGMHMQHGGIVTRPTLALVGEAGPEAVIPLNRMRATAAGGPVVNIEHAEFSQQMDVDLFMKRVAWHTQTAVV